MIQPEKKKILFIETGMGFGGSAISLKEIVLNFRNYEPSVIFYATESYYFTENFASVSTMYLGLKFTYQQKGAVRDFVLKFTRSLTLSKLAVKLFSAFSYIEDKLTVIRIKKLIRQQKIALVHINNRIDPLAINAAMQCRTPCIVHSRGHEPDPAKQEHIDYISCLLAPTQKIASHEEHQMGVPKEKITVLYDTIDVDHFAKNTKRHNIRDKYGLSKNSIIIGMFARIIPMKGQLVLAEATTELRARGHDVICMFVGDSSDYGGEYLDKVNNYISENNLSNAFIFSGYQNDTASYYAATDIVVHPSINEEAFGRIIIEAWAAQRPIIASRIGASIELIEHEETGLLVRINDSLDLANSIEKLINDSDLYAKLIEKSQRRVQRFRNEHLVTELEILYRQILEPGHQL